MEEVTAAMNSWASAATKQLLQTWSRCGISHFPSPTSEGVEKATAWLAAQRVDSEVAEAKDSGILDRASARERGSLQAPTPASPRPVQVTPPAAASPAMHVPSPIGWEGRPMELEARVQKLQQLERQVAACKLCADLACRRTQTVFGTGPANAKIVMFGEAPGADEDRIGKPFVGAAGQLMDKILIASGLKREEVYIMNSLKCRPPGNRTPTDGEIANCRPFFEAQLEAIQPEYIVCWGAVAVRAVLKKTDGIGRLRGRFHRYRDAKVLVTYHPAYLLRTPEAKRQTWEDMKFLMRELGIPIPPPRKQA